MSRCEPSSPTFRSGSGRPQRSTSSRSIFIQFADPPFREKIFAGIRTALKPGGLLLMQGYRPEQLNYRTGGPPHAGNMYTRRLLEEAFGDFASLTISEHDSVVEEGAGHAGMSALIDLVGRK